MPRQFKRETIVFSTDGAGTTQCSHTEERIWTSPSDHTQKNNSEWITDLNLRIKTIKLLEEHLGVNLHDFGLGNGFLDTTPKANTKKKNKFDYVEI